MKCVLPLRPDQSLDIGERSANDQSGRSHKLPGVHTIDNKCLAGTGIVTDQSVESVSTRETAGERGRVIKVEGVNAVVTVEILNL